MIFKKFAYSNKNFNLAWATEQSELKNAASSTEGVYV